VEPGEEAVGVVVSAGASFGDGHSAKLAASDDERLVEQAAAFEVDQQAGDAGIGFVAAVVWYVGAALGIGGTTEPQRCAWLIGGGVERGRGERIKVTDGAWMGWEKRLGRGFVGRDAARASAGT
jgi:hypothetical protein